MYFKPLVQVFRVFHWLVRHIAHNSFWLKMEHFTVILDIVLVLGTKTSRPAFLTMWLIVVGISVVLMIVVAILVIASFTVG